MNDSTITVINVPYPEAAERELRISVGACRLQVRPGEGAEWVSGSYSDPSGLLPCRVIQQGGTVRISQERNWSDILGRIGDLPATFDLALGKTNPYDLTLETGASEADLDFGGLPLRRMEINQGAGKVAVDFSAPNPVEMGKLKLRSGASGVEMRNLANANFAEMEIEGGAASYRFDFGGTLQRDGQVRISTGVSSVEIYVPASTAVRIVSESVLGGVDVGDGFMKKEGAFWNEAALAGRTPRLTISASVALGSLRIRTS